MKQLSELFKDKAPDGKKFTDMHKVTSQTDLSPATTDKAWSGKPSTTPHNRAKTKQGYTPDEDEKAYDGGDACGVNDQKTGLKGSALPVVVTQEQTEIIENEIMEIEAQIFSDLAEALELDEPELDEMITAYTDKKKARLNEISRDRLSGYLDKKIAKLHPDGMLSFPTHNKHIARAFSKLNTSTYSPTRARVPATAKKKKGED